jgi:hypothetical protein
LSNLEDSRFVVSVELQSARGELDTQGLGLTGKECLFRPFDMTPQYERSEVDDKVKSVRTTLQGLYDFWFDYYGGSYFTMIRLTI